MIRAKTAKKEIVIDLTGPEGNAFYLIGTAKRLAKDVLGYDRDRWAAVERDMMSHGYEHLVQTFDTLFGNFVILER
tara:strand:+ start:10846 stop:11073 length:228 start_codon:yes stop_codon:yes gene_type:complete